jgi:alanyl-tRNA synthetase
VEALVGADAYKFLAREHLILNSLTEIIKGVRTEELPEKISELVQKIKDIEKELAAVRSSQAMSQIGSLAASAKVLNGTSTITAVLADGITGDDLRKIALELKNHSQQSVVALISANEGRPILVVAVSEVARDSGLKAGSLVKIGSAILGGGGGGKDDFAQGGGTDSTKSKSALAAIADSIAGK